MITITRSYQEKFFHEYCGGRRFENNELYASYTQSDIPDDCKTLQEISHNLYLKAKRDVEREIEQLKKDIKETIPFTGKEFAKE